MSPPRNRQTPTEPSWRWSDLGYDMRVLTWWMRGNGNAAPTPRSHPWWWLYLALVFVAAALALFIVMLGGISIDDLRSSF